MPDLTKPMFADVPIVGQPKVHGWQITMAITCSCGKTLLGAGQPGQVMAVCQDCQVGFGIQALVAGTGFPTQMQMQRFPVRTTGSDVRLGDEDDTPDSGSTIVSGVK